MSQRECSVSDATRDGAGTASRKVELLISKLLRFGVVTALAIVVSGTVLSFVHHPDYTSAASELQRLTQPGAAFPHSLADVFAGAARGRGQAIVMIGLLVLLATPVARVAVSIAAFVYQRDWVFVIITTAVLLFLLLSFGLGRTES